MHQSLKSSSVESGALRPFQEQQQQQQESIVIQHHIRKPILTTFQAGARFILYDRCVASVFEGSCITQQK